VAPHRLRVLVLLAGLAVAGRAQAARTFSLERAKPLFDGPAARAWAEGRYAEAAAGFEAFLAGRPGRRAAAASLMAGLARARAGDADRAAKHLTGLHRRLPTLGPYARVAAAKALLALDRPAKALAELKGMSTDTPLQAHATVLRAEALKAAGRKADALALLKPRLARDRPGPKTLSVAVQLARELGRTKQVAALERKLWVTYPRSAAARALKPPRDLKPDERLARARRLHARHRHAEAVAELDPLLDRSVPLASRCTARFVRGYARFKGRKYSEAVTELQRYVAKACDPHRAAEEAPRGLYYAGRAAVRAGQPKVALAMFQRLAREHPKSTLADDALLLRAEVLADQGKHAEAETTLRDQIKRFPQGDMYEEAWWRLAWAHYRRGERSKALKVLRRARKAGVRGRDYHNRGRLVYWQARILGQLGKRNKAIEAYRRVIRDEPLSYYAQLAANRLRATHRRHLKGLVGRPGKPRTFSFRHRALFDTPRFGRGLALLSLGLGDWASDEFSDLGLLDAKDTDMRWLAALLFERAGLPQYSHNIPRRRISGFQDHPPDRAHAHHWQVAYPRPFTPQVRAAAKAEDLPPEALYGLMREESGFNPRVESYAHAFGLTQLLLKTAQHVSKGLKGVKVTRGALSDPALNLRLGARYLARLHRRFGHMALAIAGYNAGGGAVARWRTKWPDLTPDELVECIPYDQTRNYTKRVVESWGRYHFLYGGKGRERFLRLPLKPVKKK